MMSKLFIALCLLGLLAAISEAKPYGKKGRGRGHFKHFICEVTDAEGNTETEPCRKGMCTLSAISCNDEAGNLTKTIKLCDAQNDKGTSFVARGACKITDLDGNILKNKTSHRHHDSDEEDDEAPECDLKLEISFENETALAYFTDKVCEDPYSKESSEEDDDDSDDSDDDESSEEQAPEAQRRGRRNRRRGKREAGEADVEGDEPADEDDASDREGRRARGQRRRAGRRQAGGHSDEDDEEGEGEGQAEQEEDEEGSGRPEGRRPRSRSGRRRGNGRGRQNDDGDEENPTGAE